MKTVNYILNSQPDRAPEDARLRDLPKVVDLEAWKAEHLAEPEASPPYAPERGRERNPGRHRWRLLDWAELAATLAVVVAFVALAARVLLFV